MLRGHFILTSSVALIVAACSSGGPAHGGAPPPLAPQPSAPPAPARWSLPIAPRLQWTSDHGYCGETSIQAIGLYYGAWVSQAVVRRLGGGEILLGLNDAATLQSLKFSFQQWPRQVNKPQFTSFMVWVKEEIAAGFPVILASYLSGEDDPAYDHIMVASGVEAPRGEAKVYDPEDTLLFANNFATVLLQRRFGELAATRASCRAGIDTGGCIPLEADFGVAVTGLVDADHTTLPLSISVDAPEEAELPLGEKAEEIHATVTVRSLQTGKRYALLRYSAVDKVPTSGPLSAFLKSAFDSRQDFSATGATWSYTDPVPVGATGVLYYRCVPLD